MTRFQGTWFDGTSSRAHAVTVTVQGEVLSIRGDSVCADHRLDQCTIEPALGRIERTLYTPGGGRLDTADQQAFATLEAGRSGTWGFRMVHWLESRWKTALASVAVTVLAALAGTVWGIPYLAEKAAFSLPERALQSLGKGALDNVDRHFFKPSELDRAEQGRVRAVADAFVAAAGAPEPRALVFRKSPFGPNAFALPGGTVVLTDELVAFVESDEELLGVVAHELAHLENRHVVRTLLQGTGVFVLVSVLVGDIASITSVAGTLPVVLLESRYSRGFETQADTVASGWMITAGYGVEPMIAFLTRIRERTFEGPEFLSTHPAIDKRVEVLKTLGRE